MADTLNRKDREFSYVEPVNLRKLVDMCDGNYAEAGRRLGLRGSTVGDHMRANQTLQTNEFAAAWLLQSMKAPKKTDAETAHAALDDLALYFANTPALRVDPTLLALVSRPLIDILEERIG